MACQQSSNENENQKDFAKGTFGYDLNFLKKYHKDLVILGDDSSQIIVLPAYQGRVMTSTANGNNGASFGWINHELIASQKTTAHFSAYGGEERIWLGPEGGQFSIYFKKGVDFKMDNWFVPKEIDTESFELVSSTKTVANFSKEIKLGNYSGTGFDLKINRTIRILNSDNIENSLGIKIPQNIQKVGFESENILTNKGKKQWDKKTGMLSIWILSMLNASENTTVAIPYKQGDDTKLGKIVTDDYFGKVPNERLKVNNGLILFKADANYRSKIGISPDRVMPILASYDANNQVLTITQFSFSDQNKDYVNSSWKLQDNPFEGDVLNAYNDGPVDDKQMGKFYEMESSSPAIALKANESIKHNHRTIHLKGNKADLDEICVKLLGVKTDKITFSK